MVASILVGKSIILVSERSAALVSVAEAARELLRPFEWMVSVALMLAVARWFADS
jgi:hypothetical protein